MRLNFSINKSEFINLGKLSEKNQEYLGELGINLLFRSCLSWIVLTEHGIQSEFFKRRKGVMTLMGHFFENTEYNSTLGGGRTKSTRIREKCYETITEYKFITRTRSS